MTTLPHRTARVTITGASADESTQSGYHVVVEGLRTVFEIRSTEDRESQPSTISVYNLSSERARRITAGSLVTLEAGYSTPHHLVFKGSVRSIEHNRDGADRVDEIFLGSSVEADVGAWVQERVDNQNPTLPTYRRRVVGMVESIGVEVDLESAEQIPDTQMLHYTPSHGRVRDELTAVLRQVGLTWYVNTENVMFFNPLEETASVGGAASSLVVVSESTNMIGTPSYIDRQEDTGVRVRVVLTSQVLVGSHILLKSELVDGPFVVNSVAHIGDTWSGDWYSELECTVAGDQGKNWLQRFISNAGETIGDVVDAVGF